MKKLILAFVSIVFLASCGGNSTSGAQVEESEAGSMTPASFVGDYAGTLTVTVEALSITETYTFPVTATVTMDGMITFNGDDPGETFTVGLTDEGTFSGNLFINEDDCEGTIGIVGSISGSTMSGTGEGEGVCESGILEVDVDLDGTFNLERR